MADRNGTLAANTVAKVVLDAGAIEVLNRDGTDEIWVAIDDGPENPTVGDQDPDVLCLPAVAGAARTFRYPNSRNRIVRLISSGTPTYSVSAL